MDRSDGASLPPPMNVLLEEPWRSAVLTDFDGTLSPIVPDPDTAEALPHAPGVLARLARHFAVVAVVSGRPLSFLSGRLRGVGTAVRLYGNYGAEWHADGVAHVAPEVEPWMPVVSEVLAAARAHAPAEMGIEDKGVGVTLHWRRDPETGPWALAFAEQWAARTGLTVQLGRQVVELRPPAGPDKGQVVTELGRGCRAVCFAGDDAGDLSAFAALDRLEETGVAGVRLAVADAESPASLIRAADVVVPGPAEALALFGKLAARADAARP